MRLPAEVLLHRLLRTRLRHEALKNMQNDLPSGCVAVAEAKDAESCAVAALRSFLGENGRVKVSVGPFMVGVADTFEDLA